MSEPTEKRLFGVPGAEVLYLDIAEAYESDIEPWREADDSRRWEIEEWTVHPPIYHLPSVSAILDFVSEQVCENGELTEGVWDHWTFGGDEIEAAAEALRQVVAAQQGNGRMADKLIATHVITHDGSGAPLLDGEPMYRARTAEVSP